MCEYNKLAIRQLGTAIPYAPFLPFLLQAAVDKAGHGRPNVNVQHNSENDIENSRKSLQHPRGAHRMGGALHLRDELMKAVVKSEPAERVERARQRNDEVWDREDARIQHLYNRGLIPMNRKTGDFFLIPPKEACRAT